MPKISIVVPCYNVEKYIERCFNSLVEQTIGLDNLELIFIDDMSTDSTLEILLSFEKRYPDSVIIVRSPENRKQGGARNLGMQYASSDYISFVDADDWVESNMYEKLYSKICEYNYDVVACRAFFDYPNGKCEGYIGEEDKITILEKDHNIKINWNLDTASGVWSKIYRKDLILENNLWFPEGLKYEDNYWCCILKLYVNSIYMIEEKLYHYCIRLGSTVTEKNAPHHLDRLQIELMKLEKYKQLGIFDICHDEIELSFLKLFYLNTLHLLFTRFDPIPFNVVLEIVKITIETFPNFRENTYLINNPNEFHLFLNYLDINLDEKAWKEISDKYIQYIKTH